MDLFVYQKSSIVSSLSPYVIQAKLEGEISRPIYGFKRLFSRPPDTAFKGKIENSSFAVTPVILGRNSFVPQITGSITPYLTGSMVYVKFKIHPAVVIFIIAWTGFLGSAGIADLNKSTKPYSGTDLVPFGMILFLLLFAVIELKRQSAKAINILIDITEGEPFIE